ncbi:MAG: GNAT family N-acetyltransferase [Patescibacteria group bacterium]|nr:GNAT family N-acetyltransferase [Patescibacteria group bacterium]
MSDQVGVYCFLNSVFGSPSQAEFWASVEEPGYEPADRLVARDMHRIVGHAQVLFRACSLGPLPLPTAQVDWLSVTPKLQGQGLGTRLARAAESHMVRRGSMVGWARAPTSSFFAKLGWANCGRNRWSRGDAHHVLGSLMEQGLHQPGRREKVHIRPWLAWEVDRLPGLYRATMAGLLGPVERSEAYWQWLMHRQAFDQFYVAVDGPELIDLDGRKSPVVGYAAIKAGQILELAAASGRRGIAASLLARVCHEGIESGRRTVLLHAPKADRLHDVFRCSGGPCRVDSPHYDDAVMAKVLQPLALLRRMKNLLLPRAIAAGLPPRFELGFQVGEKHYLLAVAKSDLTVLGRKPTRHSIELNRADFTRMLLGQLDWERVLADGPMVARTAEAACFARVLFPTVPFWKPPLDDLKRDDANPY